MHGDDVFDEITGSIGLTGVVDGAPILKRERGQHEATLFVTGRDIEQEQQPALRFDPLTAMWTLVAMPRRLGARGNARKYWTCSANSFQVA